MSMFSTGGIYYNDWHAWLDDDMQRTSMFASAERVYGYYIKNVWVKNKNTLLKNK